MSQAGADNASSKMRSLTQERLSRFSARAMQTILKTWEDVKGSARSLKTLTPPRPYRPALDGDDLTRLRQQVKDCLEPKGGEVTARANTVALGRIYLQLNEEGRRKFFQLLAEGFDVDHTSVSQAASALVQAADDKARRLAEQQMRHVLVSPRTRLFRQFNALPDGFKFLVDMRAELLAHTHDHPELVPVETDLKEVLSAWFDIGLLDMVEISWASPAALLEKLMVYEAVHAIRSWDDLKNRLDADRRVFGFFHNKMPLEPLIFVQVAFTQGLASNVQELLDETKPVLPLADADTAIFYSISNAQKGLAGISFGNFLIKRVVAQLGDEVKHIRTYATLSPVPGFRGWLDAALKKGLDDALFTPFEIRDLTAHYSEKHACDALAKALAGAWHEDKLQKTILRPILMRLCAHYLTEQKRGKRAIDPVAHFHLSNGARLEQIHWMADMSSKGIKQSAGMMVNYLYKLSEIDENHEDYVSEGIANSSKAVQSLLKGGA